MEYYRSPIEKFIDQLDAVSRTELREPLLKSVIRESKEKWSDYPFALNDDQREFLFSNGVPIHPSGCLPHPHPACKSLETFFLKEVAANAIKSTGLKSWNVLSMKREKFESFKVKVQPKDLRGSIIDDEQNNSTSTSECLDEVQLDLHNRLLDNRDLVRYGSRWPKARLNKGVGKFLGKSFKKNQNFFIHDELHHWSEKDFESFLTTTQANIVIGTTVYPVELHFGSKVSLFPFLYEFELLNNGKFMFKPDGNTDGAYVQNTSFYLLKTQVIRTVHSNYAVHLYRTIGAHQLYVISKGDTYIDEVRAFSNFPCYNPRLDNLWKSTSDHTRIRVKIIQKMVLYMWSLKKPDLESAVAKLRQLSGDKIMMPELAITLQLASHLIRKDNDYCSSFFEGVYNEFDDLIKPTFLKQIFKGVTRRELKRKISDGFTHNFFVFGKALSDEDAEKLHELDIDGVIDDHWCGCASKVKEPQEYFLGFGNVHLPERFSSGRVLAYKISGLYPTHCLTDPETKRRINGVEHTHIQNFCFGYKETLCLSDHAYVYGEESVENMEPKRGTCDSCVFSRKFYGVEVERCKLCRPIHFYSNNESRAKPDCPEDEGRSASGSNNAEGPKFEEGESSKPNPKNKGKEKVEEDAPEFNEDDFEKMEREADEAEEASTNAEKSATLDPDQEMCNRVMDQVCNDLSKNKMICLLKATANFCHVGLGVVVASLLGKNKVYWVNWLMNDLGADELTYSNFAADFNVNLTIHADDGERVYLTKNSNRINVHLDLRGGHLTPHKMNSKLESEFTSERRRVGVKDQTAEIEKMENASHGKIQIKAGRAIELAKLFYVGEEGIFLNQKKSSVCEPKALTFFKDAELDFTLISGFAGAGKTVTVKSFFKRLNGTNEVAVISPRKELKKSWEEGIEKPRVYTHEVFLQTKSKGWSVLIFDEVFLLPNGYIDLALNITRSLDAKLIFLGDPIQASFHSMGSEKINKIENIFKIMQLSKINYLYFTRRCGDWIKKSFEINTYSKRDLWSFHTKVFGSIPSMLELTVKEPPSAILVASFEEKKIGSELEIPIFTFGESQGLTFKRVCILLSPHSSLASDFHWIVAVTRPTDGMCFINCYPGGVEGFVRRKGDSIISRILKGNIMVTEGLIRGLFKLRGIQEVNLIKSPNLVGGPFEDKLDGDPWLKPKIFLGARPEIQIGERLEVVVGEPTLKTHLPLTPTNIGFAEMFCVMKPKESREFKVKYDMSSQFIDKSLNDLGAGQPFLFEAIYPRHSANDEVTFWAAVKKRLRFSNPEVESNKLLKDYHYGAMAFKNFLKYVRLNHEFDQSMLECSQDDFEKVKLSKSSQLIKAHANRSDSDWDEMNIFLFMKSQLCTKFEKRFCDAKAGQTLACFSHLVLCKFSKWCRYIDKKVQQALNYSGNRFYIHSRKNFDQMNEWVKKNLFEGICTESDYEAYDASQDQIILAFEIELMKYLHIPEDIIHAYTHIKLNLRCKLGSFAIMRFTGEFCTFLFNTISNMSFTFMRYVMDDNVKIAFAGDDMCANRRLETSDDFSFIFEKLSLKAKVCFTSEPSFCGWRLSKYGIVKNPRLIYDRFMIAHEKRNFSDCLESYAIEACYAYGLGDRLFDILKEDDLHYYQLINRLIVKNLYRISSFIREKFCQELQSTEDGDYSCKQICEGIREHWESDGCDSVGLNIP